MSVAAVAANDNDTIVADTGIAIGTKIARFADGHTADAINVWLPATVMSRLTSSGKYGVGSRNVRGACIRTVPSSASRPAGYA